MGYGNSFGLGSLYENRIIFILEQKINSSVIIRIGRQQRNFFSSYAFFSAGASFFFGFTWQKFDKTRFGCLDDNDQVLKSGGIYEGCFFQLCTAKRQSKWDVQNLSRNDGTKLN